MTRLALAVRDDTPALEAPHLAQVRSRYEAGQNVAAWDALRAHAPIDEWTSTAERILLGRVLTQIGNTRRSRLEFLRAFRQEPTDPDACFYQAMTLLQDRGPLEALRFMASAGEWESARPEQRADWFLTRASAYGALRDFQSAERWQASAEAVAPEHPWLWVQRSRLREMDDALEAAAGAARKSLALRPWYRPAVQQLANVLVNQGRDGEALALLEEATRHTQSPSLLKQLAALQQELGQHDASLRTYWRAAELSVYMDAPTFRWFARMLSDAEYLAGNRARAIELAELSGPPWGEKLAARMREAPDARRSLLPVPFVRQHHMTCAPATLASISAFWQMPADHLTVAEAICYDGTPARSERKWAEDNGWVAREFTLTWDAGVALLDRGVPFTLSTTETASAHLQAVVGYDACLRWFLCRDPSTRYLSEMDAEKMLEYQASSGPRAMALVPRSEAGRLDGIALPDAELYDDLFRIELALEAHDRQEAGRVYAQMQQRAPGTRLTIDAALSLAGYDGDRRARVACMDQFLKSFPNDARLQLCKVSWSADLAPREERIALLAALSAKPKADPHLWLTHAQELSVDAREHEHAEFLLRRALRQVPQAAGGYASLASIRWQQDQREESLFLHRIAACLADKDEHNAYEYFRVAHALGRTDEALGFLDDRFRRFAHRATAPCRTLVSALELLDRGADALVVLERGMMAQPEDGALKLRALHAHLKVGDAERAAALLEAAKGKVREADWLRGAAELDAARTEIDSALSRWRRILELDPLAMDAHERVCRLSTGGEGPERALEHLAAAVGRFPHHVPLQQMYLSWVRDHDPASAATVARGLLELHPVDAWAWRELALALSRQGRLDEAIAAVKVAREIEPKNVSGFDVHGVVCELAGDRAQAQELFRASIQLDPDQAFAIHRLLRLCRGLDERRQALEFIAIELDRHPMVSGDGVLAFAEEAEGIEEGEALAQLLQRWAEPHRSVWTVQFAVTQQLRWMKQKERALAAARTLVERFPLVPGSWMELARIHHERGESDEQEAALRRALQLSPSWGIPARMLAEFHQRKNEPERAQEILERAVRHAIDDGEVHAAFARLLWTTDKKTEAIERMERALRVDPSQEPCWEELATWSAQLEQTGRAERLARALIDARPSSPYPCLALATLLPAADLDQRIAALDEGIRRAPRFLDLHDRKAIWLAQAGQFDEARRACRPQIYGDSPPRELIARAAWVTAEAGDKRQAVAQMRSLLDKERDFVWSVLRLAEWTHELGDGLEAVAAACRLVDLEPESGRSHGYLGDAYRLAGDAQRAKEAFDKAVALAPDYGFAVVSLFGLHVADREWAEAKALLDRAEGHVPPGLVLSRRVILATKLGEKENALAAMTQLLVQAADETEDCRAAAEALGEAGWTATDRRALEAATQTDAKPSLGDHWGMHLARRSLAWPAWARLARLRRLGELGERGTARYLETLAESGRWNALLWFLRLHPRRVWRSAIIWGAVTYALAALDGFRELVRFARGWRRMAGLEPWMLSNVVIAARACGRREEARELCDAAIGLSADHLSPVIRLWRANEHALVGETDQASQLLSAVSLNKDQKLARFVQRITLALCGADPRSELEKLWPEVLLCARSRIWRRVFLDAAWAAASHEKVAGAYFWWGLKRLALMGYSMEPGGR